LREIIASTFIIEFIGALLLFIYWNTTGSFVSNGENIFYACFHAISAFNNAGFALWNQNFMNKAVIDCYFVQTIIMLLVFLGSIGFVTLSDFFNPRFIRERKKYRWKGLHIGTKIVLITTFSIILVATVLLLSIEYNHTLGIKGNFFEKAFAALFQVISGRTAGFNIVHVHQFGSPILLLIMVMMFIGASPGSTGGGIKVTTFFVLIKSVFATIRGKKYIEFQKKMIPFELVDKSYSIVFTSLLLIIVSTFCLSLIEPANDFSHLLFETISAFSTCGLSTGCSAEFGWGGKAILVLNMYIGRIGTLTLAFALSRRIKEGKHQYPETYFMVG
jgi:Trk-type K+ transport system membrane component